MLLFNSYFFFIAAALFMFLSPRCSLRFATRCRRQSAQTVRYLASEQQQDAPKPWKKIPGEQQGQKPATWEKRKYDSSVFTVDNLPDETIYIIDGTALLYNAYYSREHRDEYSDAEFSEPMIQEIMQLYNINEGHRACGALTAMCMIFMRFIRDVQPRYVAVAYDTGNPTFRKDLFPGYKAGRKPPPPEFATLRVVAPRIMSLLGSRCFQMNQFEADDIMATISKWSRNRGLNVVHVSVDKDMLQLIDVGVHVMHLKSTAVLGADEVEDKFGIPPVKLIELQVLIGDAADNIQGVPGIGPKSAAALLGHFGTLADMYNELGLHSVQPTSAPCDEELKTAIALLKDVAGLGRHKHVYTSLRACDMEQLLFMKSLLTLRDDVPLLDMELFHQTSNSWGSLALELSDPEKMLTTGFFRYRGERSPEAAALLVGMSPSFEKPLTLLRRQYNKLDRDREL